MHIQEMTRLQADIHWRTAGEGGSRLDARLLDLLRCLERQPTLRAASAEAGLSYRAAWGLLTEASALIGAPLVELQRGRGAGLTKLGTDLLRSDERMRKALQPLNARFGIASRAGPSDAAAALRLVASHDPLLAEFCEKVAGPQGLIREASYRGSEESLALYSRGAADVAGFHLEEGASASPLRPGIAGHDDGICERLGTDRCRKHRDVFCPVCYRVPRKRSTVFCIS